MANNNAFFKEESVRLGLVESDVIAGRQALPLAEVMGEELTLIAVARTHWNKDGESGDKPGMVFTEYPDNWVKASGDNVQANIFAWARKAGCPENDDYEGCPFENFNALNEQLAAIGGLRLMFVRSKTSKGQPFNQIVFID